ncbi:hypothetical protein D4T97_015695 [Siminovitchia acidinfaciens]|uniref:HTH merR-type domain-containing protein n=1 Tax=Siminovitchia acidinfaciens TaxID=2321395 RepID=A0A429XW73_9BACI|nr:hypothetical protein D4T97_015695 [Siminovitchia acidinfaciens]
MGEIAKITDVTVRTLHYYNKFGILLLYFTERSKIYDAKIASLK